MALPLASISLDLYAFTESKDSSNATTRTLPGTATQAAILCSVQPMRAGEMDLYQRRSIQVDFKIYTDFDFDSKLTGGLKLGYILKDAKLGFTYVIKGVERSANSLLRSGPVYKIIAKRIVS